MSTKFNAAFKKWFGKSQVVDAKGRPLVVWHGSKEKFDKFEKFKQYGVATHGPIYFFTTDRKYASVYGEPKPYYLSAKNVFDTRRPEHMNEFMDLLVAAFGPEEAEGYVEDYFCNGLPHWENSDVINFAQDMSYDGIAICERAMSGIESIGVFSPNQIKSADENDGTWDADDPSVRSNHGRRCGR